MTQRNKGSRSEGRAEPKRPNPSSQSRDVGSSEHIEEALDEALAESFPASDPVSIGISRHEEAWESHAERKRKDDSRPENEPHKDDAPRDEGSRH